MNYHSFHNKIIIGLFALLTSFIQPSFASYPGSASNTAPGLVQPDGSTLTVTSGSMSAAAAKYSTPGMTPPLAIGPALRSHTQAFQPWSSAVTVDTSGSIFYPSNLSRMSATTLTLPDAIDAVAVVYAGAYTAANVQLTNAAVAGSSQLITVGDTNADPGVTAFTSSGTVNNAMPLLSFGNCGVLADFDLGDTTSPPACATTLSTTSASSSGSTALQFATNITCPALGSRVTTLNQPYFYSGTQVVSCVSSTGVITVNNVPINTPVANLAVYFSPPGISISSIAANQFVPNLVVSDWTPVTPFIRIDHPAWVGATMIYNNQIVGTVSAINSTSLTLSSGSTENVPSGAQVNACQAITVGSTFTPNNQIVVNSNSLVQPGFMIGWAQTYINDDNQPFNIVASVSQSSNTTITTTAPLTELNTSTRNVPVGQNIYAYTGVQFAAPVALGATTFTVTNASLLSVNLTALTSGVFASGTTITAINGNQVTVSSGTLMAMNSGTTTYWETALTVAVAHDQDVITESSNPGNIVNGMILTDLNGDFPANDYVASNSGTSLYPLFQPSALAANATIYACNPTTTNMATASGGLQLFYKQTNYPGYLLTIRTAYSTVGAGYWVKFGSQTTAWENYAGHLPDWSAICNGGIEGILNQSAISNYTGNCSNVSWQAPYAIIVHTVGNDIGILVMGDSHFSGNTTINLNSNFVQDAVDMANAKGSVPIWYVNAGWSGGPSMLYGGKARGLLNYYTPSLAVLQYTTPNDAKTNASVAGMSGVAGQIAHQVESGGGKVIFSSDYQRQLYGVTLEDSFQQQSIRLPAEALLNLIGTSNGNWIFDPSTVDPDPTNGSLYFAPGTSSDGIHWNTATHLKAANAFLPELCVVAGCN